MCVCVKHSKQHINIASPPCQLTHTTKKQHTHKQSLSLSCVLASVAIIFTYKFSYLVKTPFKLSAKRREEKRESAKGKERDTTALV